MSEFTLREAAPEQAVSAYLCRDVPEASPHDQASAVRGALASRRFDSAELVFVVEAERRLIGVCRLTEVLAAEPECPMARLLEPGWPRVLPDVDREDAASLAIRNEVPGLAVVDAEGRLLGALPSYTMMRILRDEHLEDIHHMAGILSSSDAARRALTAPPFHRALFRLPWLILGLAGASLATALMASFEALIEAHLALAMFVPALVYLADAIGTQTEAVTVRGVSLNSSRIGRLLRGEMATGALIGLTLAALALPFVWLAFHDLGLAVCVSLALLAAGTAASGIGFLLPWGFSRIGLDPALASGPIATVIQDLLSLLIYFLVGLMVLG
ncbi:MAG: magnesium transporter [Alphaproteobacteria bacterium]